VDIATKELLARRLTKLLQRQLGEEFDFVLIVGEKGANEPLVIHTLDSDEDMAVSLETVLGAMTGIEVEVKSGGDA
jgi:hypothetical protein